MERIKVKAADYHNRSGNYRRRTGICTAPARHKDTACNAVRGGLRDGIKDGIPARDISLRAARSAGDKKPRLHRLGSRDDIADTPCTAATREVRLAREERVHARTARQAAVRTADKTNSGGKHHMHTPRADKGDILHRAAAHRGILRDIKAAQQAAGALAAGCCAYSPCLGRRSPLALPLHGKAGASARSVGCRIVRSHTRRRVQYEALFPAMRSDSNSALHHT